MKRLLWVVALCCGIIGLAGAKPPKPAKVPKEMELSMLVTGRIHVDAGGRVKHYSLDEPEQLPANVVKLIDANVPEWEFEPTVHQGKPVGVHNRMGVLLIAQPLEDGTFRLTLRNASFSPMRDAGYEVERVSMDPPRYPERAGQVGATGTVYLILKIGADGRVEEAMAEQTNLGFPGTPAQLLRWRNLFEQNALLQAKRWEFRPPTQGEKAKEASWSIRVPVAYMIRGLDRYGRWTVYVPGPRQRAPWITQDDGMSPEALADGGLYPVGGEGGLRLVSPLSRS